MLRYAITDGLYSTCFHAAASGSASDSAVSSTRNALLDQVQSLAQHEVNFLQLREKFLPIGELARLARDILAILHNTPTRLLINARADVAAATRSPGVHLTAAPGELTPAQVRALYAYLNLPAPIISKSCHTLEAIQECTHASPPDLILFSPIFEKPIPGSPTLPGIGLEALQAACAAAHPIPVLALGGITPANTQSCLEAGAAGVAGIRLFL